jgi:putative (di)nucleoside polyphosphate hydrolase
MRPDNLPYRPCVGIALFDARGRVLIGRRKAGAKGDEARSGYEWQMPQGGIDSGEQPLAAARRELFEETGVTSVALLGESRQWLKYDLPTSAQAGRWRGRYRGQTQKWFAFRFEGPESEIDIHHPGGGKHSAEFDAWRWELLAELPRLVVPFKRAVYEAVVEEFARFSDSPEP